MKVSIKTITIVALSFIVSSSAPLWAKEKKHIYRVSVPIAYKGIVKDAQFTLKFTGMYENSAGELQINCSQKNHNWTSKKLTPVTQDAYDSKVISDHAGVDKDLKYKYCTLDSIELAFTELTPNKKSVKRTLILKNDASTVSKFNQMKTIVENPSYQALDIFLMRDHKDPYTPWSIDYDAY